MVNCIIQILQMPDVPDYSHHDEADSLQTDGLVAMVTDDTLDGIRMELSVGSH